MAKTRKSKKTAVVAEKGTSKTGALDRAIAQIEKQYGTGAIMKMDESNISKIDGITTGALSLDIALGGKGIPRGRVCELFGPGDQTPLNALDHPVQVHKRFQSLD